jgi:hypothetical protein
MNTVIFILGTALMTNLSPAAQAVLDAAYREMDYAPRRHVQWVTAAVLRAAADEMYFVADVGVLSAIATELESSND